MTLRTALLMTAAAVLGSACAEDADPVAVQALSQSGRTAFVCLDSPDKASPGLGLEKCSSRAATSPDDFGFDAATKTNTLPHLYALVTQTRLGEVAVIDLSTTSDWIVDEDPGTPGANFLPIGARPVDIVTSPGGAAAFVAVAEVGRQGLFALPTKQIRPCPDCAPPKLTSWPACRLDSAPGEMLLVPDPSGPGADGALAERPSCDAAYGAVDGAERPNGDLSAAGLGRQKLIVTLPDEGSFVVIDAQTLLNQPAGSFDACPIERQGSLQTTLPPRAAPPPSASGAGCVDPAPPGAAAEPLAKRARPGGLALAGDQLFIADLDVPVVHRISVGDPCQPTELPPLLPTSIEEPDRVVTTTRLAVSGPATKDLRRYLYAVDGGDGSVMVFDVSAGATGATPIPRLHPEWNPFQPADRIRYNAPVRDLVIVQHDAPASLTTTGVAPEGIRCDPDPTLTCDDQTASCDIAALYRTSAGYDSGAGPLKLRGTFAFLVLTSGQVTIIDIDDLDAACRGPKTGSALAGCEGTAFTGADLATSDEASCNVVIPNTPRDGSYVRSNAATTAREPGVTLNPLLYDASGAALPLSSETPKMRATLPREGDASLFLSVGTSRLEILKDLPETPDVNEGGLITSSGELRNALVMNLEDPRAQAVNQSWIATYEGVLPGFVQTYAGFSAESGRSDDLLDPDAHFCERGVQSEESLKAAGIVAEADLEATADFVQITSELPAESDTYWSDRSADSGDAAKRCSFTICDQLYRGLDVAHPRFPIKEAYQDRVVLKETATASLATTRCCFAGHVQFSVRAGKQWVVRGDQSGFLHHVIASPVDGACRNSCDPYVARLNGRVLPAPPDAPVKDDDATAFINPMFRFAITSGGTSKTPLLPAPDTQFRFATQGSFAPLAIVLSTAVDLQPQAIRLVPPTGELAITDGSLQGLILIGSGSTTVSRSFY